MDIMIDDETLDVEPTAIILTLGAVAFKPKEGIVATKAKHYTSFDMVEQVGMGRTMSADTINFWMKAGNEEEREAKNRAREDAFKPGIDLKGGLQRFDEFVRSLEPDPKKVVMWCKGMDFDIAQLNSAYKMCGMENPWRYWNSRDMRTSVAHAEEKSGKKFELSREGTYHNALDDAIYQAHEMCWVYKELGLKV